MSATTRRRDNVARPRSQFIAAASASLIVACGGAAMPPDDPSAPRPTPEALVDDPAVSDEPVADEPAAKGTSTPTVEAPPDEEMVDPGPPEPFTPSPARGPLELKVTISPDEELTVAEAESFRLNISVKNPTGRLLHPDFPNSDLLVNGKRLKYWRETVAELPQAGPWVDLPPGRTVNFVFQVADKVKVKPGSYVFVVRSGTSESPSVRLHVRP